MPRLGRIEAPRQWSREETARLLKLKQDGLKKWEIARELERTQSSVDRKLMSLKLFGSPGDEIPRHSVRRSTDIDCSDDLLRERARIMQADTRTAAQIMLGEPHPFRSMLFKKTGQTI